MRASLITLIGLVVTVAAGVCFSLSEWDDWKLKYNKLYDSPEDEAEHRAIWTKHQLVYLEHMRKENRTFEMELNEFADQILSRNTIHLQRSFRETNMGLPNDDTFLSFAPSSWDWRKQGAISPVINLGPRGIDLSVASTECVESYHFIHNGTLPILSAGEVYDCCIVHISFNYVFGCVNMIGGLCSQADYPMSTGICNKSCTPIATVNGGRLSRAGDEDALKENVYTMPAAVIVDASHASFQLYKVNGGRLSRAGDEDALKENVYKMPAAVIVDASHASFQMYRGGVYSEPACSQSRPTHTLQLVGYGTLDGQDYWICKNNWGTSWGMQGYILMARNKNNMCGIASNAVYPV